MIHRVRIELVFGWRNLAILCKDARPNFLLCLKTSSPIEHTKPNLSSSSRKRRKRFFFSLIDEGCCCKILLKKTLFSHYYLAQRVSINRLKWCAICVQRSQKKRLSQWFPLNLGKSLSLIWSFGNSEWSRGVGLVSIAIGPKEGWSGGLPSQIKGQVDP